MRHLIAFALLFAPAVLSAQQGPRTISPGMHRDQVIAALGQPATIRTASEYSYLFYPNSCGRACGMNDLVILRSDSVVDAIFRSPERHYTGQSSSPEALIAEPVAPARRTAPAKPLAVRKEAAPAPQAKPPAASKAAPAAAAPTAKAAPAKAATTPPAKTAAPAQKQMKVPGEANDVRPSIPAKPPAVKPAPAVTPSPTKKPTT
jgi:hypothetical protein